MLAIPPAQAAFSLQDLSMLLPLPLVREKDELLAPYELTSDGRLLSEKTFQRMIDLVPEHNNEYIWKNQLRVVAIRLDPCFVESKGPLPCRRQVRLVWQPVLAMNGEVTTRDAAIHSFYEFTENEFLRLKQQWELLATVETGQPLQVHSVLKAQGYRGPFWKQLRKVILENCTQKNLIRMTTMNVMADEQLWIFSGFDIVNGEPVAMQIPRVGGPTQAITQTAFQFKSYAGGMTPSPEEDPEFSLLVEDSHWFKKKMTEKQVFETMGKVYDFENPEKHNTATLDCASCHLANMARQWGEHHYPQLDWQNAFKSREFQSPYNLKNTTRSEIRPNQFRVFGYFGSEPVISQRVINETGAAAAHMESLKLYLSVR